MHKARFLSIALAGVLAGAPLAFAQQAMAAPAAGWQGHHHMGMDSGMYGKLNLTDAQRDNIRQLRQQNFTQMKPQMQALRQARQAYESATPGTAGYQTAASNLAEAEADAARVRVSNQASLRAQVYKVLTPTQQAQLASLQAQRAQRMQEWKQFRQQQSTVPSASGQ